MAAMEQPFSETEVVSDPTESFRTPLLFCDLPSSSRMAHAELLLHELDQCSESNVGQRYFLAEILKKSSIAPLDLLNLIRERGIQPSWYEIALPNGAQGMDR